MDRFLNKSFAMKASSLMKWVTIFSIIFMLVALALSAAGRQTFHLRTPEGTWERAIYSEKDHDYGTRGMTISSKDDIHVISKDVTIPLSIPISIFLMSFVDLVPKVFALYFLASVFKNVSEGRIFTEKNSKALFLYGAINFIAAILCPFLKLGIASIANALSSARLDIATGSRFFEDIVPAIGFMIAAYIIRHGLSLQDEVDHTI